MIIDVIIAVFVGVATQSFAIFFVLLFFAALVARRDQPFSSGLGRLLLMVLGVSWLLSLFGGDDCDFDV